MKFLQQGIICNSLFSLRGIFRGEIVDPKNPPPTYSFASDCSRGHINHVIKMEQNQLKTKTISLAIFFILTASLLANASADPVNFGYNKFVTNTKFHTKTNPVPQNHVISLEEKMGVSTNDMSDHKHTDRTTTTSSYSKTIRMFTYYS